MTGLALSLPALMRHNSFGNFWCARVATTMAYQMQSVAIGWQIYDITGSALDLGLVGPVIDYVSLGPLTGDDPMSRVKDIIGMIESNILENEGAAFGALLHIGDKRVCDLLIPQRDSLDRDAMNIAVKCSTGFVHSATADFYLDWLEGMEGGDQDG